MLQLRKEVSAFSDLFLHWAWLRVFVRERVRLQDGQVGSHVHSRGENWIAAATSDLPSREVLIGVNWCQEYAPKSL